MFLVYPAVGFLSSVFPFWPQLQSCNITVTSRLRVVSSLKGSKRDYILNACIPLLKSIFINNFNF